MTITYPGHTTTKANSDLDALWQSANNALGQAAAAAAAAATAVATANAALASQPAGGRTVADLPTYLLDNAVFNVKDFGAIGNGVADDTAAIQAAITAAGANITYLPAGTYKLSASLTLSTANAILRGTGKASILKATTGAFNVIVVGTAASGVIVEDLQVWGGATTNATTQYGVFSGPTTHANDCTIRRVTFSGPVGGTAVNNGVGWNADGNAGGLRLQVVDCEILYPIGVISGTGYGVLCVTCWNATIARNTFIGGVGQGRHAVYLSVGSSFAIVANNNVYGFKETHIQIYALAAQPVITGCIVVGNICATGGTVGTAESACVSVSGNVVDTLVVGNTLQTFGNSGILVSDAGEGGLCQRNVIADNTVLNMSLIGILIAGAKNTTVSGNTVSRSSQAAAGVSAGIRVTSAGTFGTQVCDGTTVIGNTSWGANQSAGFDLNPSVPLPTNTVVLGNMFGTGGTASWTLNSVPCVFVSNVSELGVSGPPAFSGDQGDASLSLQVGVDSQINQWGTNLTANRIATLKRAGATNGDRIRIWRTAGDTAGPWTLTVKSDSGTTLKALVLRTWGDFVFVNNNGAIVNDWAFCGYGPTQ